MAISIKNDQANDYSDVQADGSAGLDESLKFVNGAGDTVMELVSDADGTKELKVDGETVQFFPNISDDGTNIVVTLPETDPEIVGALWSDNGVVTVSAGPPPEE